jgi:hypothetical protein
MRCRQGGLEAWLKACTAFSSQGAARADFTGRPLDRVPCDPGGQAWRIELRFVHPAEDRPAIRFLLSGIKGSRAPLSILPPVVLNAWMAVHSQAEALHRARPASYEKGAVGRPFAQ